MMGGARKRVEKEVGGGERRSHVRRKGEGGQGGGESRDGCGGVGRRKVIGRREELRNL